MSPSSAFSEPMPLPAMGSIAASRGKTPVSHPGRRSWLPWLTWISVLLLVAGTGLFIWQDRQHLLLEAESTASRKASRLAQDMEQSLTLARRAIEQAQSRWSQERSVGASPVQALSDAHERAELLAALPLPFQLEALDQQGQTVQLVASSAAGPTSIAPSELSRIRDAKAQDRWTVGLPEGPPSESKIPFTWKAAPNELGVLAYRVHIGFNALMARLESERNPASGGVALLRLEPNGGVTLLARAPYEASQTGQAMPPMHANTMHSSLRGSFTSQGHLDGVERTAAFQRLSAPADSLIVAYGFAHETSLSAWHARLPYVLGSCGLLSMLLLYGGRRLERSLGALAESEQRFRLAAASGHVWDWNGLNHSLHVPAAIWHNLGLDAPEPRHAVAVFTELLHPLDRERVRDQVIRHLRHHQPLDTVFRLRDASGAYRWFETVGQAAWDAQGRATYMAGSAFEVTERRSLEEAQRQILHRLETVANASPALFWTADEEMRYDWVNRRWLSFTGLQTADVLGMNWIQGIHPQDQQRYLAVCHHAYAVRKPFSSEFRRLNRDGQYRWMLDQGMPRYDADGQFIGFIGASMDIDEQKRLEQEQERLNQFVVLLFRLATRFINLPLPRIDEEINDALGEIGAFVHADRAYVFTYDFAMHRGSNTHEWCAPGIAAQKEQLQHLSLDLIPDWASTHSRGNMLYVKDVQQLPAGALRSTLEPQDIRSLITLPLMGSNGCLGFVGFDSVVQVHEYDEEETNLLELFAQMLVNVYERNYAETRLNRFAAELEARVQERTEQLDASVKRLSRANTELETFTYSVSHDLKTPLRSMEGFSTLLLEEHGPSLPADAQAHLQRIQRSARHMSQLIKDLLDYSRLEKTQQVLQNLNLAHVVSQALALQHDMLQERRAQISVDVPTRLAVRASSEGMAMVLRNLIDNAVKFTKSGELPALHIQAQDQGQQVRLTVTDQGQGFDMKHHDRIFALFQRLHRPDQIAGTGIGLAMVHKAVERMEGRIWAESAPGQGASFHMELPKP